ncbi:omptin family outer membrane protease [Devosia ginsengisoli]|nr:omptin family outer membrane protease [Devosia ginsengisoli]
MRISFVPALGMLALFGSAQAMAQSPDMWQQDPYWGGGATANSAPDDTVRANASLGLMYLEGNEKVLSGDYTVSHLIWQSLTPVLRGSLAVDFGGGLSASLEGSVAGFGSGYMEDYDWLKGDDTFANWSHRSQHPDTRLDHYFTGAAALGYELVNDGSAVIRAHGGIKYSDVQWTAYGGTYTYSSGGGFRDIAGSIPDGVAGITYRQQLPELFLGVDGEEHYGNFRVGGLLRGGLTFLGVATDDHYLRIPPLRFVDSLWVAPTFTAGVDVGFALGRNAELTLAARYDHVFEQRGDTKVYDANTDTLISNTVATAAAGLRSAEITAGIKGSF